MSSKYFPLHYQVETEKLIIDEINDAFNNDFIYEFMFSPAFRNKEFVGIPVFEKINKIMLDDYLLEDVPGSMIVKGMSLEKRNVEWQEYFSMMRTARKWNQNKIVYQLDAEFEKELVKTTGTVKIPYSMIEKIPFKCFYIEFQEGTEFKEYNGMFVNVINWQGRPLIAINRITHDEICYHMFITAGKNTSGFGTEEYDENGEKGFIYNPENMSSGLHPEDEHYKEADIINANLARDNIFVLQFLTYLCAENCEVKLSEESKQTYRPSKIVKNKYSEIRKYEVGFRLGKAIRTYKKRISSGEHASGYSMKPHMRRAHWHTYYKGKGKTEKVLHWLSEIFVHAELMEEVD